MRTQAFITASVLLTITCVTSAVAAPVVHVIADFESPDAVAPPGGEIVELDGNRVLRWEAVGRDPEFIDLAYSGVEAAEWDRISYRWRVDAERLGWWGVKVIDFPLADGYQAVWAVPEDARVTGQWQETSFNLHEPDWRWGDGPVSEGQRIIFRASNVDGDAVFHLDDIRFERDRLTMTAEPTAPSRLEDGLWWRSFSLTIGNRGDEPAEARIQVTAAPASVEVTLPDAVRVPPGGRETVAVDIAAPAPREPLSAVTATVAAITEQNDHVEEDLSMNIPLGELPHPRLLLTPDDIPRVRKRIETLDWAAEAWQGIRSAADRWLEKPLEFPDRGGQWYHWYTCEKCGSRLQTQSPTEHVCPKCEITYSGWPYDDVVLTGQHHGLAAAARDLGLVYQLTGEDAYAEKAREILLGYAERYLDYPMHNIHGEEGRGACHVGPQPLTEAVWLIPLTQGFDCVYDYLSREDRQTIADGVLLPAAELVKSYATHIHNIPCWENSAYGSVGITLGNEDLAAQAINGEFGFRNQIAEGVNDDGQWYEGAWGYHYYTMSALQPLAVAAENVGIDLYSDRYLSMFLAPVRMMGPTGHLPAFNDSGRASALGHDAIYEKGYAKWGLDELAMVITHNGRGKTLEALLWGADEVPVSNPKLTSGLFGASGIAILRTDAPTASEDTLPGVPSNYVALDFGPHGGGHGHPDKLGFVLYAAGRLVAPDPGSIAYGNPAHGGWYRQTLSHNTVVVDGVSQEPTEGELLFFASGDQMAMAGAQATEAYNGVTLRRMMALLPDGLLDVTLGLSDEEHQYDWAYHSRGELALEADLSALEEAPGKGAYEWATDWRSAGALDGWSGAWTVDADLTVRVAQQASSSAEIMTAVGRGNPPETRDPFVVSRVRAEEAAWATGLSWGDSPQPQVELLRGTEDGEELPLAEAVGVRMTTDQTVAMLLTASGGRATFGEVTLEGTAALVFVKADRPVAWLLARGSSLSVAGEMLE